MRWSGELRAFGPRLDIDGITVLDLTEGLGLEPDATPQDIIRAIEARVTGEALDDDPGDEADEDLDLVALFEEIGVDLTATCGDIVEAMIQRVSAYARSSAEALRVDFFGDGTSDPRGILGDQVEPFEKVLARVERDDWLRRLRRFPTAIAVAGSVQFIHFKEGKGCQGGRSSSEKPGRRRSGSTSIG